MKRQLVHFKNATNMKKILLFTAILFAARIAIGQDSIKVLPVLKDDHRLAFKGLNKISGNALFGELNIGYSNIGYVGQASINYRSKDKFISAAYYKSHICVLNNDKGEYFSNSQSIDKHTTVVSLSLSGGIIFPSKLCPSISCGVSVAEFTYEHTTPETHIFSLPNIWATVTGGDYREVVLSSRSVTAIGIPMEFKLHLAQRHNIGFDVGTKVDINTESVIVAGVFGIRFGKVAR